MNIFKDKTVAIVGNADVDVDVGAVNMHDVVIVMNGDFHQITPNVYCYSGEKFFGEAEEQMCYGALVYHMTPKGRDKAPEGVEFYLEEWWHILYNTLLGSRPTTGMMVIDMVRRSNAKSISLYGFDFFDTGTCAAVHSPNCERRLCQEWGII